MRLDYVLGFAPAEFSPQSEFMGRLYTRPSNETINRGPPRVYTCKKITHARWRSYSPCQSSAVYGNTATAQHALSVRGLKMFKLDNISKKKRCSCHCESFLVYVVCGWWVVRIQDLTNYVFLSPPGEDLCGRWDVKIQELTNVFVSPTGVALCVWWNVKIPDLTTTVFLSRPVRLMVRVYNMVV